MYLQSITPVAGGLAKLKALIVFEEPVRPPPSVTVTVYTAVLPSAAVTV
jgi:hypothetical protein